MFYLSYGSVGKSHFSLWKIIASSEGATIIDTY